MIWRAGQLRLHLCRHRHVADPATRVNHPRGESPASINASYAAASLTGSCRADPSSAATSATTSRAPAASTTSSSGGPVGDAADVGEHGVHLQVRGVLGEHRQVVGRVEARGSPPPAASRLSDDHDPGVGARPAPRASSGTSRCGITRGEPGARARARPSRPRGRRRPPPGTAAGRPGRGAIETIMPVGGRDLDLAAHGRQRVGVARVRRRGPAAAMSSGASAIGSTRPCAPSSRPTQSSAVDVVAEQLPERDDQQVADDVAAHLAVAGEPVLQHPRPGPAPLVVAAERGQRHPQVARRQHAELARAAGPTSRRCRRR